MIRRRKFLAKPNMSSATPTQSQPTEEKAAVARPTQERMEAAPAVLSPVSQAQADEPQPQIHLEREQSVHLTELQPVQPVQLPSIENMVNHFGYNDFPPIRSPNIEPQHRDAHPSTLRQNLGMNGFDHEMQLEQEPMVDGQVQPHPHRPLSARPSVNRQHQETLIAEREKEKREPIKDKLVDTKKFRMSDLVSWRPKTENTLKKKWNEKRRQLKNMEGGREAVKSEPGTNTAEEQPATSSAPSVGPGPRVKINERGEMVVDEASLVVVENPENRTWETVNDDLLPKKITSLSFRKKNRRGSSWSVLETDLFYEVLAATGTDFALMHEFIPTRTRIELKKKFNKEERSNARRINETLRHPAMLDERLRQRVERMLEDMGDRDV